MKKKLIAGALLAAGAAVLVKTGKIRKIKKPNVPLIEGNASIFRPEFCELNPQAKLFGKRGLWLGSSITVGAASLNDAMSDYLMAEDGMIATKEAISGTTLAGPDAGSYFVRLKENVDPEAPYDFMVLQLSTNDTRQNKALGAAADGYSENDFDSETTLGALEAILAYARTTWNCPVLIYSCLLNPDDDYEQLIEATKALQAKWQFAFLDLNHNEALKAATKANPSAMADDAHPTRLGYRNLWTPLFRQAIEKMLNLSEDV